MKVQITATQHRICQALGIPVEVYVRELVNMDFKKILFKRRRAWLRAKR